MCVCITNCTRQKKERLVEIPRFARKDLMSDNEMAQQRGQSMAQMALSWLLKDNRVTSVLIGASRPEQLEENVQSLANLTFSAEELAQIDKHVADGKLNLWQASSDK